MPAVLNNFLAWVLTGVNDDTKITLEEKVNVGNEEVHRHVMSIAQDIVHAGSHGRIRTPKHFILPMTVHHLTRSEQLVTMLSRLGHGYSSSRIEEYETALAERFLASVGPTVCFCLLTLIMARV